MLHLHFALLSFLDIALCGSRTRRVLHIFNNTFALPLQVDSMLEVCNVFLLGMSNTMLPRFRFHSNFTCEYLI